MDDIAELADDLYRRKVLAARAMDPYDKLMAGPRLFDIVCERMITGIKIQHPNATPDEIQAELSRRLAIARNLENTNVQ